MEGGAALLGAACGALGAPSLAVHDAAGLRSLSPSACLPPPGPHFTGCEMLSTHLVARGCPEARLWAEVPRVPVGRCLVIH